MRIPDIPEQERNDQDVDTDEGNSISELQAASIDNQPLIKAILLHSLPLMVNNVVVAINQFGSAIIISSMGSDVIAASAYVSAVSSVLIFPAEMILHALQPILGSKVEHPKETGSIVKETIVFGMILSFPLMVALLFTEPVLVLFGQNPKLAKIAGDYFLFDIFRLPASMTIQTLLQFFIASKRERLLVPVSMVRTGADLSVSYLLINAAKLDTLGWRISTVVHQWISLGIILTYTKLDKSFKEYDLFHLNSNGANLTDGLISMWRTFKDIIRIGLPIGIQLCFELAARFINPLMLGHKSSSALTAYHITSQYTHAFTLLISSLSTTSCVLISQALGKGFYSDPKRIGLLATGIGAFISFFPFPVFCTMPRLLASFLLKKDSDDYEEIQAYSRFMFPIVGLGMIGLSLKYISTGSLRGYGKTSLPMMADFLGSLVVGVGLSVLLGFVLNRNALGIAIGEMVGVFIAATIIFRNFIRTSTLERGYDYLEDNELDHTSPSGQQQSNSPINLLSRPNPPNSFGNSSKISPRSSSSRRGSLEEQQLLERADTNVQHP
ncbi:5298_t:CDS:1 [Ambispora gerdemannii]|uniref:5298_t:CDS:1 n=1 Tax=Ambispora gerdemannii TaxID=144530 RepID=A0A9N8V0Q3_9GLOM|nr:5298_t:CDS:1 [Ambispora gerdemannii]